MAMPLREQDIVSHLPAFRQATADLREILLANLVLLGETPAPTFGEEPRVQLFAERLADQGLQNCAVDEWGNGLGVRPGRDGRRTLLLATNADTFDVRDAHPNISIRSDRVIGPFVGDNSLAMASLATLPALLDKLHVELDANLVLMAASRSLGKGNLEGLRLFLDHAAMPIQAGLWLESVQLGRLNFSCLGMARGDIICRLPEDYNWAAYGATGTIIPVAEAVQRLSAIALPKRPLTTLVIGQIHGGISYQNIARETRLGFEARSESADILDGLLRQIADAADEISAAAGMRLALDVFARRAPGKLEISHPLPRLARAVLGALGLEPMIYPTTSGLAALLDHRVPALVLGLTRGTRSHDLAEIEEYLDLAPLPDGLAQVLGLVLAMDGGLCDDPPAA
jgi:hypothetical protein